MSCLNCGRCRPRSVPFNFAAKLTLGGDNGVAVIGVRVRGEISQRITLAGEITVAAFDANGPMFDVIPINLSFTPAQLLAFLGRAGDVARYAAMENRRLAA